MTERKLTPYMMFLVNMRNRDRKAGIQRPLGYYGNMWNKLTDDEKLQIERRYLLDIDIPEAPLAPSPFPRFLKELEIKKYKKYHQSPDDWEREIDEYQNERRRRLAKRNYSSRKKKSIKRSKKRSIKRSKKRRSIKRSMKRRRSTKKRNVKRSGKRSMKKRSRK